MWNVESFSDHRFVTFSIDIELELRPPSRNPRKTNWESFNKLVVESIGPYACKEVSNVRDLDQLVNRLSHDLVEAYEKSCPLPKKPRKQNPPWWNKSIAESVKKRKTKEAKRGMKFL